MAYAKLNLTNGTKLTADHLAHIEQGIVNESPFIVHLFENENGELKPDHTFQEAYEVLTVYKKPIFLSCVIGGIATMIPLTMAIVDAMMFSTFITMDNLMLISFSWQQDDTIISNVGEMQFETWEFTLEDGSVVTKQICSIGE